MPVIAVINSKGGAGKTTLALNLGLFLSLKSKNIVFIDLDPQNALTDWLKRRPKVLSQHTCKQSDCESLSKEDLLARNNGTYYILDCPAGLTEKQISILLGLGDIFLMPTTPNPVDLAALTHFFFQLASSEEYYVKNKPIAIVANRSKVYTHLHSEMIKKFTKFNIPLIGVLRDTQNYTLPSARGMGLIDLPPYRVKADIESWNTILTWILKQNCT